ncbi:MAG: hypothetical protein KAT15_26315, partial [Bacteroidales bacterium]|nr:hypothetical protein [Bacteroidales bacterium]
MERDQNIARLIREAGVVRAPDRFSEDVMKIVTQSEKPVYKPLIGRTGRILIILSILAILVISLVYSEPGGRLIEFTERLPEIKWQIPEWNLSLEFFS